MELIQEIWAMYNWQAMLATLLLMAIIVKVAKTVLFKVPLFKQTRELNIAENKHKFKTKRDWAHRQDTSKKVALGTYLVFFLFIVPFITTFEAQPVWRVLLDIFLILMVYDFFYYWMHRSLFHGKGYFRRVHAVHHQARSPTFGDSLLLHPMEAFLGVFLFVVTTTVMVVITGDKLHVATMVATMIIYTQINTFNHVKTEWNTDKFPLKTLDWIACKHAVHHIDMHKGNYATITLLFDKMFGTLD